MDIYRRIRNFYGKVEKRLILRAFFGKKKNETRLDKILKKRFYSKLERSKLFELFYIVPITFSSHPLIALLIEEDKFRFDDPSNILMLPIGRELANKMGIPVYIKDPCQSYVVGLTGVLDKIWNTVGRENAGNGDTFAVEHMARETFRLIWTMREALIKGKLFPDDQQFREEK